MASPQTTPTVDHRPEANTLTPAQRGESIMLRDGYMKPDAAAEYLGCGKRWLLDGLNHHGFPHTRMGQAKWLSPEDCEEIRKLCRVPAEPAKISKLRRRSSRKPARAAA
jgi:hypothetical protein